MTNPIDAARLRAQDVKTRIKKLQRDIVARRSLVFDYVSPFAEDVDLVQIEAAIDSLQELSKLRTEYNELLPEWEKCQKLIGNES